METSSEEMNRLPTSLELDEHPLLSEKTHDNAVQTKRTCLSSKSFTFYINKALLLILPVSLAVNVALCVYLGNHKGRVNRDRSTYGRFPLR